jgi:hypothetical protein
MFFALEMHPQIEQTQLKGRTWEISMSGDVKLKPGWLTRDVNKAAERVTEWANASEQASDKARAKSGIYVVRPLRTNSPTTVHVRKEK